MNHPTLIGPVIDAVDARAVGEFWRELMGFRYRQGDEPPLPGAPDRSASDWLVLTDESGRAQMAVQAVTELPPPTWPDRGVPQQIHLDLMVGTTRELADQHDRVLALGGAVLDDRRDSEEESIIVFADPAGHPFCILVAPTATVPTA